MFGPAGALQANLHRIGWFLDKAVKPAEEDAKAGMAASEAAPTKEAVKPAEAASKGLDAKHAEATTAASNGGSSGKASPQKKPTLNDAEKDHKAALG